MLETVTVRTTLAAVLAALSISAHAVAEAPRKIDIPPGKLITALEMLARQSGVGLIYTSQQVKGLRTKGVHGELTTEKAVTQLLEGTKLKLTIHSSGALLISDLAAGSADAPAGVRGGGVSGESGSTQDVAPATEVRKRSFWDRFRLAQAASDSPSRAEGRSESPPRSAVEIEEVVVTGSHIRGEGGAAPILTFDREAIKSTGLATSEQFLQTLPQNFNGGAVASAAHNVRGGEGSDRNFSQGTGVNLRGLGNDGTLVLLNGHRLAPAGVGNFVDVSGIPLSALERIEVLTDGASAVYGSDAIAGVVNFITRKDYEGAETAVRYGSVTRGDHGDWQMDQTFGGKWNSGSALLSASYYDRSRLDAGSRFPDAVDRAFDLVSPEHRIGVVSVLTHDITDDIALNADATYSRHKIKSSYFSVADGGFDVWDSDTAQGGATLGLNFGLGDGWRGSATGAFNRNHTMMDYEFIADPPYHSLFDSKATVASVDIAADGALIALPGGLAKVALGSHYRRETYDSSGDSLPTTDKLSRDVYAAYAELFIPVFGPNNAVAGAARLELTLAGRYEDYSDFGHTVDPKIGLLWSPIRGISLRGTYGTSFRAPTFSQLDDTVFVPAAMTFVDASSPTQTADVILIQGNNAGLTAERARTWTAGIDLTTDRIPESRISLTYFSIDFEDRIAIPVPFSVVFGQDFLSDPAYAFRVSRNPDIDAVTALFQNPRFNDFTHDFAGGAVPADIVAIVDDRLGNVTRRKESGLDLTLQYGRDAAIGHISLQTSASYLIAFKDKVAPAFPFATLLNSVSNPVDFRLRNSLGWTRGGWGATVFLNYIDGYQDVRPAFATRVASWTTVDLAMSYNTRTVPTAAWLRGVSVSVSAQNLLDREPPFAASLTGNGIDYDSTNASPLGRFVSLQLAKAW
jgi:outer membrane receptor protein involved in Fe transport